MIPVSAPLFDGNESKYLQEAIASGWVGSDGDFVKRFELEFAQWLPRNYAVAVSSGTAALDIAIACLNLQPGDEVILPALTIISCVNQIVRCGAIPVLVDIDPETHNMNVGLLERAVTKRTRAILMVHLYGLPTDVHPVLDLAKRYGIKVIEDAAQAHALKYRGKLCGTFGDISTFSFYSNKLIACGEGGMIVTDDIGIASNALSLRNLCMGTGEDRFTHPRLGWNYRLTNLQAAVGLAQLETIERRATIKRQIGEWYDRALCKFPANVIQLPWTRTDYADNIYWCYPIILKRRRARDVIEELKLAGIDSRPFFTPLHEQPCLTDRGLFRYQNFPRAQHAEVHGLYLPTPLDLTQQQVSYIAGQLERLL